jgi:hypothetical protein
MPDLLDFSLIIDDFLIYIGVYVTWGELLN